jgi:DNA-binding response OmpR family regulator
MTGLLDNADVLNRADELKCEYLGKPFAPEALIAKIESARRMVGQTAQAVIDEEIDTPVVIAAAG